MSEDIHGMAQRLLNQVKTVGEFTEFDQTAVVEAQKVGNAEAQ